MDVDAEVWLLVADELEAQKLIVTWPKVWQEWREHLELTKLPEDSSDAMDALIEGWGELSGVEEQRIRHFVPILFENQLLGWDGTQADRIMGLLRAQVAATIRRQTR